MMRMMPKVLVPGVLSFGLSLLAAASQAPQCPPAGFDTQGALKNDFDLSWYTKEKWHIQQQMVISYLPADYFSCVTADYTVLNTTTFLGYNIEVKNHAENADGKALGPLTTICAKTVDEKEGKFDVSPCFLPTFLAGKYWVVAYDKEEDWALVSGGPPSIQAENGCTTGTGTNNSGLWIFTRRQKRDEAVITKIRNIAKKLGFDVSVLKDVDQMKCVSATDGSSMSFLV